MTKFKNDNLDELEEGFQPVQYKILKLNAKDILAYPPEDGAVDEKGHRDKCYRVPKPQKDFNENKGKKSETEDEDKESKKDPTEQDILEKELNYWLTNTQGNSGLITVGDNILFQKIREVNASINGIDLSVDKFGNELTPNQQQYNAYKKLKGYRKQIKKLKREINNNPNSEKIAELHNVMLEMEKFLFVPDVINVESGSKTDYDKIAKHGFYYGDEKYIRRSAGSGNLKQNTVTFIREKIENEVVTKLRIKFGADIEIDENILAPSKFGAYEGLSTTGCLFVSKPNVVVIPDFEYITFKDKDNKDHRVYYVQKYFDANDECKEKCTIDIRPFFETKAEYDEEGNFIRYNAYLNSFDGMGLIDPVFAEKWAKELHLDYLPSAFNVRSIGVKGLLVTFPFKEYAKNKGVTRIVDVKFKGTKEETILPVLIDNIDVILTESQWKYKKLYKGNGIGYDFSSYNCAPDVVWGVQRVNPKVDKECVRLNYQLNNTTNIVKDEDFEKMVEPLENYLRKIAEGKPEYVLYSLMKDMKERPYEEDEEFETEDNTDVDDFEDTDILDDEEDSVTDINIQDEIDQLKTSTLNKALMKNPALINDKYVAGQLQKIIKSYLKRGKAGKLYPNGNSNYQFMISDPYGLCQWAFGWYDWMDENGDIEEDRKKQVKRVERFSAAEKGIGLIPPKCVYSNYWRKKKVDKIDACRSPMTDIAEHNILTVCNDDNISKNGVSEKVYDEMQRYYRYIKSGIIYSLYDLSTVKHSDSDFDSDMVCTLNSKVYIENAWDVPPTTYDKGVDNMQTDKYNLQTAIQADKQGFGNKVGNYSNLSTSLFAMLPSFSKENGYKKHSDPLYPEYDCTWEQLEIFKSIKKDRYLIGEEIDSTKTGVKPVPTDEFKYYDAKSSMSDIKRYNIEERGKFRIKYLEMNKLKPKFMPYAFIYVKEYYKEKYDKYISEMREICKLYTYETIDRFVPNVLHGKRELITDDEKYFWEYFVDNCPLLLTDCIMNKICWKLEIFEDELDEILKEHWSGMDKFILFGFAKEVKVNRDQRDFIKEIYEEYVSEITSIYNKNNRKSTEEKTSLYQVGKREALTFKIRKKLMDELQIGFSDIFNMLVMVLKDEYKTESKLNSINGFLWNVMGDDLLAVIPYSEKGIDWEITNGTDGENILGENVVFKEYDRTIVEEEKKWLITA